MTSAQTAAINTARARLDAAIDALKAARGASEIAACKARLDVALADLDDAHAAAAGD